MTIFIKILPPSMQISCLMQNFLDQAMMLTSDICLGKGKGKRGFV